MSLARLNRISKSILIAIISTLLIIILALFLTVVLPLTFFQKLLMFFIFITLYGIMFISFYRAIIRRVLLNRKLKRSINPLFEHIQTAINDDKEETPVYEPQKETTEVRKEQPKSIKYQYVGSTETRKYHKTNCRFSKLIKSLYKLESNDESFFKKKKFKPCKTCMKKKK